jgi:hypothetical protein
LYNRNGVEWNQTGSTTAWQVRFPGKDPGKDLVKDLVKDVILDPGGVVRVVEAENLHLDEPVLLTTDGVLDRLFRYSGIKANQEHP